MRKQLHIGEMAQLLGVTTRTIRHYHKIGLLQEPERTESGYRLYSSLDLSRLQRVRHLQSFGLPLKHIKIILGEPGQEHTLREILLALDLELAGQISLLEERRIRIQALLNEDTLKTIEQPETPTFTLMKNLLGERLATLSPDVLALEARLWEPIDNFQWPDDYREHLQRVVASLIEQPELYERVLAFGGKLAILASLPENAPEVDLLIEEYAHNSDFLAFLHEVTALGEQVPHLESPFSDTLGSLMSANLSPALKRFFEALAQQKQSSSSKS